MTASTALAATTAVVLATLLVTGPLVDEGNLPPEPAAASLGDGNATVDTVDFDPNALTIERGRFGSGVMYLRLPEMTVLLDDVRDNPRLVYSVRVPALEFERVATRLVKSTGTVRTKLEMSDRAFEPATLTRNSYRAHVSLRIQSFAVDRTVFSRNVTVAVVASG